MYYVYWLTFEMKFRDFFDQFHKTTTKCILFQRCLQEKKQTKTILLERQVK